VETGRGIGKDNDWNEDKEAQEVRAIGPRALTLGTKFDIVIFQMKISKCGMRYKT
jgi:hypothetical protein